MNSRVTEMLKLEERVLFEAAAAIEIVEAADILQDNPNANVSESEKQAQEDKDAIKNAPPENISEENFDNENIENIEDISNVDYEVEKLTQGDLPDTAEINISIEIDDYNNENIVDGIVEAIINESNQTISTGKELVVINDSISDKKAIVDNLELNQELLVLEEGNGLQELNEYLDENNQKYDAIHLVSHGNDGYISINGETVNLESFNENQWEQIGAHLNDDADIFIYGCNTAESEDGKLLIEKIATSSSADVAASIDSTGFVSDWDLEFVVGSIENQFFSVENSDFSLIAVSTEQEFKDAISDNETTIELADDFIINDTIIIDYNTDIEGDYHTITYAGSDVLFSIQSGDVTISNLIVEGANNDGTFVDVASNSSSVTLENIVFSNGDIAIENSGTLSIVNSTIANNSTGINNSSNVNLLNSIVLANTNSDINNTGNLNAAYSIYGTTPNNLTDLGNNIVTTAENVFEKDSLIILADSDDGKASGTGVFTAYNGTELFFRETMQYDNWIALNGLTEGNLPANSMVILNDIAGNVIENRASIGAYFVASTPETRSLNITTNRDIVDEYDELISLREALIYANEDAGLSTPIISADQRYKITFSLGDSTVENYTIELNSDLIVGEYLSGKHILIDGRSNSSDVILKLNNYGLKTNNSIGDWTLSLQYLDFTDDGISIIGNSADISLNDVGVDRNPNGNGLTIDVNEDAKLQLFNGTFANSDNGVSVNAGETATVHIISSTFGENLNDGISVTGDSGSVLNVVNVTSVNNQNSGIALSDGTLNIYNSIILANGNDIDANSMNLNSSVFGEIGSTVSNQCGSVYIDATDDIQMNSVFETVVEENGIYRPVISSEPIDWFETYALRAGTTDIGPSVAGGMGQWVQYTLNDLRRVSSISTSKEVTGPFNSFWGAVGSNDSKVLVAFDERRESFINSTPSAGAYFVEADAPSLIVTTHKDVYHGSDGLNSLREALLYAQTCTEDVTITFDYAKLSAEKLPASYDRYSLVMNQTWGDDLIVDPSVDSVYVIDELPNETITIDGTLGNGLSVTIDATTNALVSNATYNAFSVAEDLEFNLKNLTIKNALNAIETANDVEINLDNVTIKDSQSAVVGNVDVTAEYSSFYNFDSKVFNVDSIILHNSTVGGNSTVNQKAQIYNTTIKGDTQADVVWAVNSIFEGDLQANSNWLKYNAFSNNQNSVDSTNIVNNTNLLSENIVDSNLSGGSFYTIDESSSWAQNGTLIVRKSNTNYDYAVRQNIASNDQSPDEWVVFDVGTEPTATTINYNTTAVIVDQLGRFRNPHIGYLSMGAWQAQVAIAWKTIDVSGQPYLGINGQEYINRNNYYNVMQTGVDNVYQTSTTNANSELTDDNPSLYLWNTQISNQKLSNNQDYVQLDKDISIIGKSYNGTVVTGSGENFGAIYSNTDNIDVVLRSFSIVNSDAYGVEIVGENGELTLDTMSVNNNDKGGIFTNSQLHLINSTVANNNGNGITSNATSYIVDSTIATNSNLGLEVTGSNLAYLLNSISLGNKINDIVSNNYYSAYSIYGTASSNATQAVETISGANPNDIFVSYSSLNNKANYSSDGRTIAIKYLSDAGHEGTKIGVDSNNNYYYLVRDRAADTANIGKYLSFTDSNILSTPPATLLTRDQRNVNRLGGETLGFAEYAMGAYVPSISIDLQLMNQEVQYNGRHQTFDVDSAIYKVTSNGLNEVYYYDTSNGRVYQNYDNEVLSGELSSLYHTFYITTAITQKSAGVQVNVLYDNGNIIGYKYHISDATILRNNGTATNPSYKNYTSSYSINYIGDSDTEVAPTFTITPLELEYVADYVPTRVYDGTNCIDYSSFRFTNVINGEVTISNQSKLVYSDVNVGDDIDLVIDNFQLVGSQTVQGNYTLKSGVVYTANITPREITVEIADESNQYNGEMQSFSDTTLSIVEGGLVVNDALNISGFTIENGGITNNSDVNVYNFTLSGVTVDDNNGGNNYIVNYNDASYSIVPKEITITLDVNSRVYDGTNEVKTDLKNYTFDTGIKSESFTIGNFDNSTLTYNSANVSGNENNVSISSSGNTVDNLSGNNGAVEANYDISYLYQGVINRRDMIITITDAENVYDGDRSVFVSGYTFEPINGDRGQVNSETLTVTGEGETTTHLDAGVTTESITWDESTFQVTNGSNGGKVNNYNVTYDTTGIDDIVITRKEIDLTFSSSQVYDGTTEALSELTLSATDATVSSSYDSINNIMTFTLTTTIIREGETDFETFTITVDDAIYDSKNSSTNSITLSNITFANGNNSAELSNYTFNIGSDEVSATSSTIQVATLEGDGNISKLDVFYNDSTSKVYDATTNFASSSWNGLYYSSTSNGAEDAYITNLLNNSGVALTIDNATYNNKNVHNNLAMNVLATSLTGTIVEQNNYSFKTGTVTASISPKSITITGNAVSNVYNGITQSVGIENLVADELVGGDKISNATFGDVWSSRDVISGFYSIVDVNFVGIGGDDVSGNYNIVSQTGNSFSVTPKDLTISFNAKDKTYDGTNVAQRDGEFIYGGLITNDDVVLDDSLMNYTFATNFAGNNQVVTANNYDISNVSGNDIGNYNISFDNTSNADINKAQISISANSSTKLYDGNSISNNTYTLSGTLITNDQITSTTITGSQTEAGTSINDLSNVVIENGSVDVTQNYDINMIDGILEVTQRNIIITSDSNSWVYDGTNHADTNYTLSGDGFIAGQGLNNVTITGLIKYVGTKDNTISSYTLNSSTSANNYYITKVNGTLEVTKASVDIDVTANSSSKMYDSTALIDNTYTLNGTLIAGDSIANVEILSSQTNVGTSVNDLSRVTIKNAGVDVTLNYNINMIDGTLEVTERDVIVTANSNSWVYDGTTHTDTNYSISGDGFVGSEDFNTVNIASSIRYVGTTDNIISSYTLNSSTDANNYNITVVNGTLEVTKASIDIDVTANSSSKMYDSTALSDSSYTLSGALLTNDVISSTTITGSQTNAGTSANSLSNVLITNNGVDVTDNYNINMIAGTLEVTQRDVTITSDSMTWVYDGTTHTDNVYTISDDGFASGEGLDNVNITGSIKHVGTIENTIDSYTLNSSTNANNYNITTVNGTLEVISASVSIDVIANSSSKMYDGTALVDNTYTLNGTLLNGDIISTTVITGSQTDVNTSVNDLSSVTITHNGVDVSHNYNINMIDGTLEVTKRAVTITSDSMTWVYDGTTHTDTNYSISNDGFVVGEGLDNVDITGSIKHVGTTSNTIDSYTLNSLTNANNYNITTVNGTLEVINASVSIDVIANSNSKVYDGTALVDNSYTLNGTLLNGDIISTTVITGSQTDVNTSVNDLSSVTITHNGVDVSHNYNINMIDGTLEVTERDVIVTANSNSWVYDGTTHTDTNYSISGDGFVGSEDFDTVNIASSIRYVGTTDNIISNYTLNSSTDANNYNITVVNGTLEVTKASIDIDVTANSSSKMYDSTALSDSTYTLSGALLTNDVISSTTITGSQTNAGTSVNSLSNVLITNNGVDVTDNYNINMIAGTLEVTQRNVTITSDSMTWVYDGTTHTDDAYTISNDGFVLGEGLDNVNITGSIKHVGTTENTIVSYTLNSSTNANNYNITTVNGTLEVISASVSIDVIANSSSKMYDGTALVDNTYTLNGTLLNGDIISTTVITGSQTDVSTSVNDLSSVTITHNGVDVSHNYNINMIDGTLEVIERDVIVTANSNSWVYDGTTHTDTNYSISGDGFVGSEDFDSVDITSSIRYAGTISNVISNYTLNSSTNSNNYNITVVDGTLEVTKASIDIDVTANSSSKLYDSTAITNSTYTLSGSLLANDIIASTTITGSQTNAGTSANSLSNVLITNNGVDVTDNYNINMIAGTLEVTKRNVTITSNSNSWVYDGTTHSDDNYSLSNDGFINGDGLDNVDIISSIKYVGVVDNIISDYTLNSLTNANNYNITTVDGSLEITKASINIDVTANSSSKLYDSTAISNSNYTLTGTLIAGDNITSTTITGSQTNAGISANTLTDVIITNNGVDVSENYNINMIAGTLEVNKRSVTITSNSNSWVYDGTTHTDDVYALTGDGFVAGEGLSDVDITGSIKYVGSTSNSIDTYTLNNSTNLNNYNIATVDGVLTITRASIDINLTANSSSKIYDGTALNNNSYTLTGSLIADDEISSTVITGSQTSAGSSVNGILAVVIANNGVDVTENYNINMIDGTLEVTPRTVYVVANDQTKVTGQADPDFTYQISNLVAGESETGDLSRETGESAGKYTINLGSLAISDNYIINYTSGTLTILPTTNNNGNSQVPSIVNSIHSNSNYASKDGNIYATNYSHLISIELREKHKETLTTEIKERVEPKQIWMDLNSVEMQHIPRIVTKGNNTNHVGLASGEEMFPHVDHNRFKQTIAIRSSFDKEHIQNIVPTSQNIQGEWQFRQEILKLPQNYFIDSNINLDEILPDTYNLDLDVKSIPKKLNIFKSDYERVLDELMLG